MPRYRLLVEYDGGPYCGFQAQQEVASVQGSIERAIFAFCGQSIRLTAAGRTDTGVHALGQVISFDLETDYAPDVVRNAINAYLGREPISIVSAQLADPDFSARFSALGRVYRYRVLNRPAPPSLDQGQVWHVKKPLDQNAMQIAAQMLMGTHDFTTFRDTQCQSRSPIKTLDEVRILAVGDEVHFWYAARSFLHRQVRSMTGSLVDVGLGRWTPDDLRAALEAKDRRRCAQVAPAHGLCLMQVDYTGDDNRVP